jgi:hypothetical protein
MGNGRLGHRRTKKQPEVGDLVVCLNPTSFLHASLPKRFVGLVLNKAITICKIQVVESGRIVFWQLDNMMLWKETK